MVKRKQKIYLSLGIIFFQTTLMANGLASVLISQKTEDTVIENNNFDGESVYSFLWGKTDFFSSSLGSYVTIGGTVDFRSDEDVKNNEESGDFDNYKSYNVYNTGLTYTPTSNLTLLGGVGYGQSKGKYYQKNTNSSYHSQLEIEKEKGVNFNLGVNYYYKSIGIVAMYDTFPKVFSVGLSYNFATGSVKEENKQTSSDSTTLVSSSKSSFNKNASDFVSLLGKGALILGKITPALAPKHDSNSPSYSSDTLIEKDAYEIIEDKRDRYIGKKVIIECLRTHKKLDILYELDSHPKKPYREAGIMTVIGYHSTLDPAARASCRREQFFQ